MSARGYHTRIVIAAPPSRVWDVLTDFASYPDWNPLVGSLEGEPVVGRRVAVHVIPLGRHHRPRITAFEPPHRLAWTGWEALPFLLSSTHYFRLEPTPEGHTRLDHGERFRGLAAPLLGRRLLDRMHQAFIHHDLVLKQRVESGGERGGSRG
jgi:hypothetical protein